MGPIRNPNWSTSGMRVMLSYLCLALKQFYIKNVGPAKIQRVQQKMSSKMKTNFKKSARQRCIAIILMNGTIKPLKNKQRIPKLLTVS